MESSLIQLQVVLLLLWLQMFLKSTPCLFLRGWKTKEVSEPTYVSWGLSSDTEIYLISVSSRNPSVCTERTSVLCVDRHQSSSLKSFSKARSPPLTQRSQESDSCPASEQGDNKDAHFWPASISHHSHMGKGSCLNSWGLKASFCSQLE